MMRVLVSSEGPAPGPPGRGRRYRPCRDYRRAADYRRLLRLLRIVCGILRLLRGIGFLLGRLLVRLLRSLRLFRFLRRLFILRILRLLRGIGLLLLGGASLSPRCG